MRSQIIQEILDDLKKPTWKNFKIKFRTELWVIKYIGLFEWLKIYLKKIKIL